MPEPAFWNEQKQAMVHNRVQGKQSESVTRYANMFSVFFNYLNADKQQTIKHTVLQNDSILKITTPYMRFYELEALCALGEQESVMKEMKAYWGGMLKEGATSIYMDKKEIRIKSDGGKGVLNIPTRKGMKAMTIEPGKEQVFKY